VLAWLCTIVSFLFQLNALKKISAFTSNLTYNLEPVYGILLAFVIFHENRYLTGNFYFGLSLILLAVILQTLRVYIKRRTGSRQEILPRIIE
jgi:drug/metabolite transporter (DMT)-like permease